MKNKQLVVSHFEKDMEWTKSVDETTDIAIYSKSSKENEYLKLANLGREPHTYAHHIIENYDNLHEWTLFCQDDPIIHVSNWIQIVNSNEESWKNLCCMSVERTYYFFIAGVYTETAGQTYNIVNNWKKIFNENCPSTITFVPACNFIAHRDSIRSRSLDFYVNLKNVLETEPNSPWEVERMITYIFKK